MQCQFAIGNVHQAMRTMVHRGAKVFIMGDAEAECRSVLCEDLPEFNRKMAFVNRCFRYYQSRITPTNTIGLDPNNDVDMAILSELTSGTR